MFKSPELFLEKMHIVLKPQTRYYEPFKKYVIMYMYIKQNCDTCLVNMVLLNIHLFQFIKANFKVTNSYSDFTSIKKKVLKALKILNDSSSRNRQKIIYFLQKQNLTSASCRHDNRIHILELQLEYYWYESFDNCLIKWQFYRSLVELVF